MKWHSISIVLGVLLTSTCGVQDFPELEHVRTKTSSSDQAQAVVDLITRTIGTNHSSLFIVKIDPSIGPKNKDTFRLTTVKDQIMIEGTSGIASSLGFYHYLKYSCNSQFTWAGASINIPQQLPKLDKALLITTNDRFRYYKNVCTESYSFAFWQWERWEREIDWMALHGINMPLAFTGQEAIYQKVYISLGVKQAELDTFFGGPAFLAWARMGNLKRWGGPLPQGWIDGQLALQVKILARMRSLGMTPVLPGFAGFVPENITRVFPKANVTRSSGWAHFNSTYSHTFILDFGDPLYTKIGGLFIQEMTKQLGSDHLYNADSFNEMGPKSGELDYLASAGKAVFSAMTSADPDAIWVMQAWTFANSGGFWNPDRVKALITGDVPIGRMILLDLESEINPVFKRYSSYFGQPFIWNMIHNFGGMDKMFGDLDRINTGPFDGRSYKNSTMIGIGLTPEGINQNEIVYEFMMENAWRTEPRNVDDWVQTYAEQRYGAKNKDASEAWDILRNSVYKADRAYEVQHRAVIVTAPSVGGRSPALWYNVSDAFTAWDKFVSASSSLSESQLFKYDLTDVTRNALQFIFVEAYKNITASFTKNDTTHVMAAGVRMNDVLTDLDKILSSSDRFLVGSWLNDAISWGTTDADKKLLNFNARNQITLWGPDGEIEDYAAKQWAGLTADYYKPRWAFFTQSLLQTLKSGSTKFNGGDFHKKCMASVEKPWTMDQKVYSNEPKGDTVAISKALLLKYRPIMQNPIWAEISRIAIEQNSQKTSHANDSKPYYSMH